MTFRILSVSSGVGTCALAADGLEWERLTLGIVDEMAPLAVSGDVDDGLRHFVMPMRVA